MRLARKIGDKRALSLIYSKTGNIQSIRKNFDKTIEAWQRHSDADGNNQEQMDDITIAGVRF